MLDRFAPRGRAGWQGLELQELKWAADHQEVVNPVLFEGSSNYDRWGICCILFFHNSCEKLTGLGEVVKERCCYSLVVGISPYTACPVAGDTRLFGKVLQQPTCLPLKIGGMGHFCLYVAVFISTLHALQHLGITSVLVTSLACTIAKRIFLCLLQCWSWMIQMADRGVVHCKLSIGSSSWRHCTCKLGNGLLTKQDSFSSGFPVTFAYQLRIP